MLTSSLLILAAAATGLAQTAVPEGYRKVYITSKVDPKFVIVPKSAAAGATLVVQVLNNKPEQQWIVKNDNKTALIQKADTNLCMDGGAKANWKDMAAVSLKTCNATEPGQGWIIMNDGRIALDASKSVQCLDLQYMRATANNPVGFYQCAGLGNTGAADKGINWPLVNATASP